MTSADLKRRAAFAVQLTRQRLAGADRACPYCGGHDTPVWRRKLVFMDVLQCQACGLKFRYPKPSRSESAQFYQNRYDDYETGLVTDLPAPEQARRLLETGFDGTRWDESERIAVLKAIAPKGRLLDYGCTWGYLPAQARAAGYDARGFEISRPRGRFGREHLGLDILTDLDQLWALPDGSFDVIYTSHVLEHLSEIGTVLHGFYRLLAPGGTLFVFVPNGGSTSAQRLQGRWPGISEVHTLWFERAFFERNLPMLGFDARCFSEPYEGIAQRHASGVQEECTGEELLVVARK